MHSQMVKNFKTKITSFGLKLKLVSYIDVTSSWAEPEQVADHIKGPRVGDYT